MKRPLLLTFATVRPIGNDREESLYCMGCLENEGKWLVGVQPNDYVSCAYCFLYASPWGKKHSREIEDLVLDTEQEMKMCISDGGKVGPENADRILASIVLVTMMVKSKALGAGR